jgi:hypothetical protein
MVEHERSRMLETRRLMFGRTAFRDYSFTRFVMIPLTCRLNVVEACTCFQSLQADRRLTRRTGPSSDRPCSVDLAGGCEGRIIHDEAESEPPAVEKDRAR